MTFTSMHEVHTYLNQFTPKPNDPLPFEKKFDRMKYFMHVLGDPQNKLKVVHIAGTSGKGSTSYIISKLLEAMKCSVGLSISPHLYDLRERTQINNQLISEAKYCQYLSKLYPHIEAMKRSESGAPSYFEISMAMSYLAFWTEGVDYAVMETGLGGRYDATNTATSSNKVCVITKIGFDHMDFLGDTLAKIAAEKAHIMQEGNVALSVPQEPEVANVLDAVAQKQKAHLTYINIVDTIKTTLHGAYQQENLSLALAVIYTLSKRDALNFDQTAINESLMNLHFPGRFEVIKKGNKTVILDGAHNPQKMEAFIGSLKKEYPDKIFDFLISFKKGKQYKDMLKYIVKVAQKMTVTQFSLKDQGMMGESDTAENIVQGIYDLGCKNVEIVKDPKEAFEKALARADDVLVVTGSLYLLSEIS